MSRVAFTLLSMGVLFWGCSSKKYFEPEQTFSASHASSEYEGKMVDLSRDGGKLDNGKYISQYGVSSIKLDEGYRFLNEDKKYLLASNAEGILNVIDKKTQKSIRAIHLHIPVVSATIHKGLIAYVLNNNAFGIYRISNNNKIIESRSEATFAIDTRAATPLFIDTLAVMPMLDGKMIVVNTSNASSSKIIYISSQKEFNNVIYLSRYGNTLIGATPTKVITLGSNGQNEYRANISEVAVSSKHIYLFTKEGEIIALSHTLQEQKVVKYKFAHYAVATVIDDKVYALDQKGSLIVSNASLTKRKIYELGEVKNPAFIAKDRLYKDEEVIALSKLGYE